jgi:hypothetical protein
MEELELVSEELLVSLEGCELWAEEELLASELLLDAFPELPDPPQATRMLASKATPNSLMFVIVFSQIFLYLSLQNTQLGYCLRIA